MEKKIELRRVEYSARLSEETNAYAAELWVDGVHLANVKNDGGGGCDTRYPTKGHTFDDIRVLDAHVKATYPKLKVRGLGKEIDYDLELLCGDLLEAHLQAKAARRVARRK